MNKRKKTGNSLLPEQLFAEAAITGRHEGNPINRVHPANLFAGCAN